MSVCESVCATIREHISGTTCPIFTKFPEHLPRCSSGGTAVILSTYGFVGDVTFSCIGQWRYVAIAALAAATLQRHTRNVRPCCVVSVASHPRRRRAPKLDESIVQGETGAESAMHHSLVVRKSCQSDSSCQRSVRKFNDRSYAVTFMIVNGKPWKALKSF